MTLEHGASASPQQEPQSNGNDINTNSSCPDDFDDLRRLLICDNKSCRNSNARKRCTRCKAHYYCSVDCQRMHWKHSHKRCCVSCDDLKAAFVEANALPIILQPPPPSSVKMDDALSKSLGDTTLSQTNENAKNDTKDKNAKKNKAKTKVKSPSSPTTSCGICLVESMRHPVVLPECNHVFCFKCISDFQGQCNLDEQAQNAHHSGTTDFAPWKKACPYCRTSIEKDVFDEALKYADLYITQARRLTLDIDADERDQLYQLAQVEVDKLLEADPLSLTAHLKRAYILMHNDPPAAILAVEHVLQLDRVEMAKQAEVDKRMQQIERLTAQGKMLRVYQLMNDLSDEFKSVTAFPRLFGEKNAKHRLLPIYVALAEAYEAAGQYAKARDEYTKWMDEVAEGDANDASAAAAAADPNVVLEWSYKLLLGMSRCRFHCGENAKALMVADQVLKNVGTMREIAGIHMCIARPLLAFAEQVSHSLHTPLGAANAVKISGYEASIAGAIQVMYQGLVYEEQWNDWNKRVNRAFLQELLDKQAKAASVAGRGGRT